MFERMDIFVYSGTGNTYKAAQYIGEAAKHKGVEYEINMIDVHSKPEEYHPAAGRLLGLMSPTIGAIQPLSFFHFILRLPKGDGQKVFLAATGAWTKIGPVFIPGYVGYGLYLAALFLILKGYRVTGITGFGMPHNWTTLIPPYSKNLESRINREIGAHAAGFADDMLAGKKVYRRIVDLVVTLLIFPLPILFLMFGHYFLAKTMFAGTACNGCGLCAENCPRRAIKMYGGKKKRPYWTYRCEQCMRCAGYCPNKAVDCNSFLFMALLLMFFAVPVEAWVGSMLNKIVAFSALPGHTILLFIAYYIIVLLLGATIYGLFYLLSRIPPVSKVFTVLSFTHYWRKYRQENVKGEILSAKQHKEAE